MRRTPSQARDRVPQAVRPRGRAAFLLPGRSSGFRAPVSRPCRSALVVPDVGICSNGSSAAERALHFRHPGAPTSSRMSKLQQRFPPGETSVAFPTSSRPRGCSPCSDVVFAATVPSQPNGCCISDIRSRFSGADVVFAATVSSGANERCVSDIRVHPPHRGCRICSIGSLRVKRALRFRHPKPFFKRGCRICSNGFLRGKRALHFRRPGLCLGQMSRLDVQADARIGFRPATQAGIHVAAQADVQPGIQPAGPDGRRGLAASAPNPPPRAFPLIL